jgi:hypothetical protein
MVATVRTTYPEAEIIVADWTGPLANGEAGNANRLARFTTKSAHATGTFGVGGSVAIEGSNDGDNWFALTKDDASTAIALTAASPGAGILENTLYIRPRVTAGDGTTALRVIIVGA